MCVDVDASPVVVGPDTSRQLRLLIDLLGANRIFYTFRRCCATPNHPPAPPIVNMSFFNNLKKVLHLGGSEAKKKRTYNNIRMECDMAEFWELIGELGDGAFGKVYKAQHKETQQLAAAKMCTLEDEDNLSDHMVEIDILSEIKHENVVKLYEAYSLQDKLWVSVVFCIIVFLKFSSSF